MPPRLPLCVLCAAATFGCGRFYEPGSLVANPSAITDARTIGCLDIAVRAVRDPIVAFELGNRCHYPVGLDFRNVTVRAWTKNDVEYQAVASDPRSELFEAVLDAHESATVTIDFHVHFVVPEFCIDIGRLNVDTPAPGPEMMCFEDGEPWHRIDPAASGLARHKRSVPTGASSASPEQEAP